MRNTTLDEWRENMDEDLKNRVDELEKRVEILERYHNGTETQRVIEKPESLGEFLDRLKVKSFYDKTLGIAYFKENSIKISPLSNQDLERGYKDARESLPKNFADTIYQNKKKHYFRDIGPLKDGVKAFVLTQAGINRVHELLEKSQPAKG